VDILRIIRLIQQFEIGYMRLHCHQTSGSQVQYNWQCVYCVGAVAHCMTTASGGLLMETEASYTTTATPVVHHCHPFQVMHHYIKHH